MEQRSALKQAESGLTLAADRISSMGGKLEDLFFRAQRIASALKNNLTVNDTMFGYDLQTFRREVRTFSHEVAALPNLVGGIERSAVYDEESVKAAQALQRICARITKSLKALADQAMMAHSHIREADHRVEAWYLAQELEQMASKGQSLPTICNKLVLKVSDIRETQAAAAPKPPEAPPGPPAR